MPPRPDATSAPEPWSDADFLPVEAILRARPHGGTPSSQRLGLIRSRLQVAAPGAGHPQLHLVPRPSPARPGRRRGDAAADRPLDRQPLDVLPRAGPVAGPGRPPGGAGPGPPAGRRAGPRLVGRLLGRAGALQPGDDAGRGPAGRLGGGDRDPGDGHRAGHRPIRRPRHLRGPRPGRRLPRAAPPVLPAGPGDAAGLVPGRARRSAGS